MNNSVTSLRKVDNELYTMYTTRLRLIIIYNAIVHSASPRALLRYYLIMHLARTHKKQYLTFLRDVTLYFYITYGYLQFKCQWNVFVQVIIALTFIFHYRSALVEFANISSVIAANIAFNGSSFKGRQLKVRLFNLNIFNNTLYMNYTAINL